jgi:hypothetical protein
MIFTKSFNGFYDFFESNCKKAIFRTHLKLVLQQPVILTKNKL